MTLESTLEELTDPDKRLSAQQLANLSGLDRSALLELRDAWDEIPPERRLRMITQMAEMAEDNVDLNFDGIYKVGLEDEEAAVRAVALTGLSEYEGRDVIPTFVNLLRNDPESAVRREAAIGLGRYAVAAELGHLTERDADMVKEALTESAEDLDEDELVRARAIEALGAISGEEVENLIESIYEEDSIWLKLGAVDAMGRSAHEVWLPLVMRETENAAPEMRHAAAFAAGEIGEAKAVPRLKRMAVEDPDREVQLAAVHALGEIGGAQARVALKSVLYEGDDALQPAIEEAMANIDFDDDPMRPGAL